jgi:DNA-binding XRE family transcriptional regulator
MIDPEAISTLNDCAAVTGHRYLRIANAVERGRLIAIRSDRGHYQVRGSDLIAWRDRVSIPGEFLEPVYRQVPPKPTRTPPSERLTADEIRRIRVRLGLSQTQLADGLGFTRTAVSRWETGRASPNTRATRALNDPRATTNPHPPDANRDPCGEPERQDRAIGGDVAGTAADDLSLSAPALRSPG